MVKHIQRFLSSQYYISTSDVGNDGVYDLLDDRRYKSPVYGDVFLKELLDVFALTEEETKRLVFEWAAEQKKDVNLDFFWATKEELFASVLPIVQRYGAARTIGLDLVPVRPMSAPNPNTLFLDYQYSGATPNQNGRVYEIADNNASERFNNIINQLARNQNNYIMGVDPYNLED